MRALLIRQAAYTFPQINYGMAIIATILNQAGHEVKAIANNSHYKYYSDKDLLEIAKTFRPDIIGFSIAVTNAFDSYNLLSKMRPVFSNTFFIAGGIHMKNCSKEALNKGFDIVINREGEKVVVPLLEYLKGKTRNNFKKELRSITGVSYIKEDGTIHSPTEYPVVANLDEVPFANYKLFNLADFFKTGKEPEVMHINGQRGCPYECTFCSDEIQRMDKRIASADYMYRYLSYVHNEYGVTYIVITDNNFLLSRQRVINFCQKMIQSGMSKKVAFTCQTNLGTPIDDEAISLLKKAGCWKICFGLERLDPYSLAMIKKNFSKKRMEHVFFILRKHDIKIHINMMIGFPFETVDLLKCEKRALLDIAKHFYNLSIYILRPTPGNIYYENYPKAKEWYLNARINKARKSYFEIILNLDTFEMINFNFFNLPKEVIREIRHYYLMLKKSIHGQQITTQNIFVSLVLKLDVLLAKLSIVFFQVSPSLEFWMFRKIKFLRFYLGTLIFGNKMSK